MNEKDIQTHNFMCLFCSAAAAQASCILPTTQSDSTAVLLVGWAGAPQDLKPPPWFIFFLRNHRLISTSDSGGCNYLLIHDKRSSSAHPHRLLVMVMLSVPFKSRRDYCFNIPNMAAWHRVKGVSCCGDKTSEISRFYDLQHVREQETRLWNTQKPEAAYHSRALQALY